MPVLRTDLFEEHMGQVGGVSSKSEKLVGRVFVLVFFFGGIIKIRLIEAYYSNTPNAL